MDLKDKDNNAYFLKILTSTKGDNSYHYKKGWKSFDKDLLHCKTFKIENEHSETFPAFLECVPAFILEGNSYALSLSSLPPSLPLSLFSFIQYDTFLARLLPIHVLYIDA